MFSVRLSRIITARISSVATRFALMDVSCQISAVKDPSVSGRQRGYGGLGVFWWFERGGRYVRCEIRFVGEGGYAFVVTGPDGVERVEEFTDSQELSKRQVALERELAGDGWTGPHGWNI